MLPLFIVLFLFILDIPVLLFRYRLKKFIKNNRTYSTDVLYRLVACHNDTTAIYKLSYNKFKKLILDQIPTNEIHYETVLHQFLPFSFIGVRILSHFHFDPMIIVRFDKDVTEIWDGAFSCADLEHITIPPSVTKIGHEAFNNCSSLSDISIPPSVTEIGEHAFRGCSSLTSITVSKDNKVYDSREDCNAIIHTESNTLIRGCKKTIIPPSVTEIGAHAFSGCSSLTRITIPPSVKEIGGDAFYGCSSLTRITVSKNNKVYDSREVCNAIIHTESNTLIRGCKKTIIPPSVTEIGHIAFSGCSSLTSITIPPSVTKIGWYAFYGCSSLTRITIPESVTEIGYSAFSRCSSLTEVRIPKGCNVHEYAFYDSTNVQIIRY